MTSLNVLLKFSIERILSVILFPFILILHIFFIVLIKLDSKGSVIFKQKRLGKDNRSFSCYKYRTMYENSNSILESYLEENPDEKEYYSIYHKYKNDPRVTRIGKVLRKTSLDELPQFYNILRGDMNLIGPRPYMIKEKDKINKESLDIITKVKPGITGLWQVSGRNKLTFKKRIELDTWYILNWSLWLDLKIFIKTIFILIKIEAK